MRDDAEVARKLDSHGSGHYAGAAARGQSEAQRQHEFRKVTLTLSRPNATDTPP